MIIATGLFFRSSLAAGDPEAAALPKILSATSVVTRTTATLANAAASPSV